MKLIKWNFWILKEHNNFSYLWKFEPDISNSFGEILFEKPKNLHIYVLINLLPPSNFAVFNCCYFFLLLITKSWNLYKLPKLTRSFNFWTFGIYGYIFYRLTHMQMSKNVNNNVTMNPPFKRAPQLPYEKGKIWVFNR